MFNIDMTGRKIRILNTVGASFLAKNKEYIVEKVYSGTKVYLKGTEDVWYSSKDSAWEYVEDIQEKLSEGDEVIVVKSTTSLKTGQVTRVLQIAGDKGEKIIVEGIIPGGWVKRGCLMKVIDTSKLRIKEAIELLQEFGPTFSPELNLSTRHFEYLGKQLDQFKLLQTLQGLLLQTEDGLNLSIHKDMYTDKPYEPMDVYMTQDCDIVISNLQPTTPQIREELKLICGKPLSTVRKNFNSTSPESINGLCSEFNSRAYVKISTKTHNGIIIPYNSIEIKKVNQNEPAQVSIPF